MNTYQHNYFVYSGITPDEYAFIQEASAGLNTFQMQTFMLVYNSRRKNPVDILFATLFGFLGLGGVQRLLTKQYGWAIIYMLTGGLFMIGTLYDLFNYKSLTNEYNSKLAYECYEIATAAK
jgi:TM2 domain-containing membrane protein YozV